MKPVIRFLAPVGAVVTALAVALPTFAEPPPAKQAKVCFTCHKTAEPGTIRGHFDQVAMKSRNRSR